jgi:hypothetical protein
METLILILEVVVGIWLGGVIGIGAWHIYRSTREWTTADGFYGGCVFAVLWPLFLISNIWYELKFRWDYWRWKRVQK